jgi:Uncharacterized conserved protein
MDRKAINNKIFILGVDGLDPRLTKKYLDQGKMPNIKKFIEKGSTREDLIMLGGQPTGTPPMWTTLATGCNSNVHGITCFNRASEKGLEFVEYNFDSRKCKAEQLWNVFAEQGKKTLVWHWPGSAWPPTSDSSNLHVVDGTQPASVNAGLCDVESDFFVFANEAEKELTFISKMGTNAPVVCEVSDMKVEKASAGQLPSIKNLTTSVIVLNNSEGTNAAMRNNGYDKVLSPIKQANGWVNAPADAKEFTILFSSGLIRRVCLIIKNEKGIYDTVKVYKTKKDQEPLIILPVGEFVGGIIDEFIKNDEKGMALRSMRVLELAEDGSSLKIWVSTALKIGESSLFHPRSLYDNIAKNVGYPPAPSKLPALDKTTVTDCMKAQWDYLSTWQAEALNYLIDAEGYQVIFSHLHNVDAQMHRIGKHLIPRSYSLVTPEETQQFVEDLYVQTDNYIGKFLHLLDEGWTVFIISDHAVLSSEHERAEIADAVGINVGLLKELGFTEVLKDENGNDLHEIDWSKTKAVASRANHIYINLKGRNTHGIVEPEDQYEVEEEIMTALYGYKDKETGKRVVALAIRNKDAVLLGMGGPDCGDIIYWTAEGYNDDHFDALSTTLGCGDTSVSPVFIAAGPGIKENFKTDRIIKQIDFVPTVAIIGGVRMPAQCEGAPIYQILTEEY